MLNNLKFYTFAFCLLVLNLVAHASDQNTNEPVAIDKALVKKAKGMAYDSIPTDQPLVALTFDDGPDAKYVPRMLELFNQEGVRATFYVLGKNVKKHPDMTRRILSEGHELGNHSVTHANLAKAKHINTVREEIENTQKIIKEVTGSEPVTFRAPYIAYDKEVWMVIGENDLVTINANRWTNDWEKTATAEIILNRATKNTKAGDIILLHSWNKETFEALPQIIADLKAKGLEMVTVSEMLETATPQKK